MIYLSLFTLSFLVATIIPFGSEVYLAKLIIENKHNILLLLIFASVGNILGSNIFNIAIVISIVGFLDNGLSHALSELYVIRDIAMILITTLGFYIIIKNYNQYLTKILCLVLLFSYILYQFNLYGINI